MNDPEDPGGETKFGISKRAYPDVDIANLTIEAAAEIYRRDYWERPEFDGIKDAELAIKVFNLGVNIGVGRVSKFLQMAANLFGADLKVDGAIGPVSLGWINGYRFPGAILSALRIIVGNYYINLKKPRFLAGWLIRLDD